MFCYVEIGFGYILDEGCVVGLDGVWCCGGFVEKFFYFKVLQLIVLGLVYWVSGILFFIVEIFIIEFVCFVFEMFNVVKVVVCGVQENFLSCQFYVRVVNGLIEQMIFECFDCMLMMLLDVEWDDVGCWILMYVIGDQDVEGNFLYGDVLSVEIMNLMVCVDGKFVVVVGVLDLIVVDMFDVLLVIKCGCC